MIVEETITCRAPRRSNMLGVIIINPTTFMPMIHNGDEFVDLEANPHLEKYRQTRKQQNDS